VSGDLMTCDECGYRFDELNADKSESGASDMCPGCGSMDLTECPLTDDEEAMERCGATIHTNEPSTADGRRCQMLRDHAGPHLAHDEHGSRSWSSHDAISHLAHRQYAEAREKEAEAERDAIGSVLHTLAFHAARVPIKQHKRSADEQAAVEGFTEALVMARKTIRDFALRAAGRL
jgi:hypothetical protein